MTRTTTVALLLAGPLAAADPPTPAEVSKATKPAVALVTADAAFASAACVSPRGYFVVPAGVVADTRFARPVEVRLNAGEKGEAAFAGRAVRIDPATGLALIRVDAADPLPALPLGDDDGVTTGTEGLVFAHPPPKPQIAADGKSGRYDPLPVAARRTKVAGRQEFEGRLLRLQVEESDTPAAAGSPLLDLSGRLIGLHAGGGAERVVIPVSAVRRFLAAPDVTLDVPPLDPAKRFDPLTVRVGVFSVPDPPADETVELVVRSAGRERTVEMKRGKGEYEAAVAPFEKADDPPPVRVEVAYPDGAVRGLTPDRKFSVGGKEYTLAGVSGERLGSPAVVRLPDGTAAEGEVKGLAGLAVTAGGKAHPLAATARELTVLPPTEPAGGVRLTAVVRRGGKEVGRASTLRFLPGSEPFGLDGMRLGLLVKPPRADRDTTYAALAGTDGEHHFGGRAFRFDEKRMRVSGTPADLDSAVAVELHTTHPSYQPPLSDFQPGLSLRVQSPFGKLLGEREYPTAVPWSRVGFVDGAAGLKCAVDGREIHSTYGRVAVWQLEVADGGKAVDKLALDAILYPDRQTDTPVFLSVRLNSKYK